MLPGPSTKSLFLLAAIPFLAQVALSDSSASSSSDVTTSQLISQANVLLSTGQAHKALELYELALERNPDDYLTLYKKATTQMSLGQFTHASHAFQKVLSLSEFERARLQLAKIHLKMGDYEACESELASCSELLKASKADPEALRVQEDLKAAQKHFKSARANHKSKRWDKCVEESTATIQYSPQSVGLRQLRSDCHIMQGHLQEAVGDLTRVSQLLPNSPLPALRVSTLSYFFLAQPLEPAIKPIKQCLHSDPESRPCKKMFRTLKAVEKDLTKVRNFINSNGYRSAIKILNPKGKEDEGLVEKVKQTIKESQVADAKSGIDEPLLSPTVVDAEKHSELLTTLYSYICQAYISLDEIDASKTSCNILHERDNENAWGVIGKAEVLMAGEEWEQAVQLLNKAYSNNENNEDLAKRLRKAQKGLKVSKQKDYYKVLGVSRSADEKTLKKAYRKASLKAHPDKGGSQAKMAALNEAYEVLSNPELRARYDNGDDPNDPTSGHGHPFQGGGNPIFQQFFQQQAGNPFGGGAFQGSSGGQTFSFRFG